MNAVQEFKLSGTALPKDAGSMLDEICEHFVEHSEVQRTGNRVVLKSETGTAGIHEHDGRLLIELSSPTEETLNVSRNVIAEHLFYFSGDDPLELTWSKPAPLGQLPNIHEVTVVSAEDVTPRMRRVTFACDDLSPFLDGDMHVRLLVPPKGRTPVWPGLRDDGRVKWPEGEDEILVRIYTIRGVDVARGQLWIDFVQHPEPGVVTPGADFARDAQPGERVALLGPGGGDLAAAGRRRERTAGDCPHRRRDARRHPDEGDHRGSGRGGRATASHGRLARGAMAAPDELSCRRRAGAGRRD